MKKIVLASKSPRRKKLLEQIGLPFTIFPSKLEEKMNPRLKPKGQAKQLSLQKAQEVSKHYKNAIIIAADTLVVFDNEIIGKPTSLKDAKQILKRLSGKSHMVITGYTILDSETQKSITKSENTKVYMRKLTDKEIDSYVKTEEPLDKAGAYAGQEKAPVFIEKIEGDFFNIVGLPICAITQELKKFNVSVL